MGTKMLTTLLPARPRLRIAQNERDVVEQLFLVSGAVVLANVVLRCLARACAYAHPYAAVAAAESGASSQRARSTATIQRSTAPLPTKYASTRAHDACQHGS